MRKFIYVFLICIFSVNIYADYESPMTKYKDNYFIAGNEDVKFQVSAKYNLIYPFDIGVYFAYSQVSFWDIYDKSSPFRDSNYNPEAFWLSPGYGFLKYFKCGYEHKSNGRDSEDSRGFNRGYAKIELAYGEHYQVGLSGTGYYYTHVSRNNKDYDNYNGLYEVELFYKTLDPDKKGMEKEKIYVKGGSGKDKGWIEGGIITRIFTTRLQPRIFIQGFHGYSESLLDYNKKETQIRGGVLF